MKKIKFMAALVGAALMMSSCGSAQGNGTLIGGAAGGAIGALVGNLIKNKTESTLIGTAIGTTVGAVAGNLIGKKMDKAKAAAMAVENAKVSEVTDANGLAGVKIEFDNGILFNTGKADLKAAAQTSLKKFATTVLNVYTDCDVDIHGFASSDGSDQLNLTLSQNRANSVKNYLTGSCGVAAAQIKNTVGHGEDPNFLIKNSDGTENMAASRRVEVYLYASEAMIEAANAGTLQ